MNHTIIALILLTISITNTNCKHINGTLEDKRLNFTGFALKYAGAVAEYDVTTEDGYILKLFRIPGDKTKPVLLMHGLLCSSNDFIIRGNDSLAITLAHAGYDVWLSNYRGNMHSRRHHTRNPDTDASFWRFGPYEHGYYDLATSIDFVLNKTKERSLSLIGHSEGMLITYILGAERPEYNDKIKIVIALAPACHLEQISLRLPKIEQIGSILINFLKLHNIEEFLGFNTVSGKMLRNFCSDRFLGNDMCRQFFLFAFGFDPEGLEPSFIPTIFNNFPAGTSRQNIEHSIQFISSGKFKQFDYGPITNFIKYGSEVPPEHDLKKVTMKMYIIAAKNDKLSVIEDNGLQAKELPNVEEYIIIENELFNHMDFIWGRHTPKLLHYRILEILKKYN
ncbi:lipase 1-like [Amyelois transitella]|uniref:lipase 1-like n=1 Tax=Amyelois transitella TaxID=680683 RepID=UPI00298FDD47|nr:lipase 1-like [Amyelois transitella]XP_060801847.1 lipase 1-like [Amyelois transitella]XP_060801848.1 lipase 1-like [Amyelois transitella]